MTEDEKDAAAEGLMKFARTRFLPALDSMFQIDRDGAIADMLQVLRERGVLKQMECGHANEQERMEMEGFAEHSAKVLRWNLADHLDNEGVIKHRETVDPTRTSGFPPYSPMTVSRVRIEVVAPEHTDFIVQKGRKP